MHVFKIPIASLSVTLVACIALWPTVTQAQQAVGNGGDALVCDDGSRRLLDLYEADARHRLINSIDPARGVSEIIDIVLDRWERVDPRRVVRYRDELATVFVNDAWVPAVTEIVHGIILEDVPDDQGYLYIPRGCIVEQVIIQTLDPQIPGQRRFTISGDIWDEFDNMSKAALVIHELLFAEAIRTGASSSWRVRYLTGHLFSDEMNSISRDQYAQILDPAGFLTLGEVVDGIRYMWDSLSFYPTGELKTGRITKAPDDEWPTIQRGNWKAEMMIESTVQLRVNGSIESGTAHQFQEVRLGDCTATITASNGDGGDVGIAFTTHENDVLASVDRVPDTTFTHDRPPLCVQLPDGTVNTVEIPRFGDHWRLDFYDSGQLKRIDRGPANGSGNWSIFWVYDQEEVAFYSETIEFHENGLVKLGDIRSPNTYNLMTNYGTRVMYRNGGILAFDSRGRVIP